MMKEFDSSPDDRKTNRFDGAAIPRSERADARSDEASAPQGGQPAGAPLREGLGGEIRDVSLESLLGQIEAALAAIASLDDEPETGGAG